jgi:hypothetical protein
MAQSVRTTILLGKDLKRRLVKAAKRNHVKVLPLMRLFIEMGVEADERRAAAAIVLEQVAQVGLAADSSALSE